ncbi:MAG: hypothetical protein U9Q73_02785 [Nanoarchaeota archaeon]|nr:hypothetical protein [Nanoarchaeota archaeon]
MKLKTKLSNKQEHTILYFIIGIIVLLISFDEKYKYISLSFLGICLLVISFTEFISASIEKYKVIHTHNSGNYDSEGERKIAEYFKRKNIRFDLHPKVKVNKFKWINLPFFKIELTPDFFLPEFNVFIEYWGMIDNEKYKEKSHFKKKKYKENDIDFISLYPKNLGYGKLDFAFTSKLLDLIKDRKGLNTSWN